MQDIQLPLPLSKVSITQCVPARKGQQGLAGWQLPLVRILFISKESQRASLPFQHTSTYQQPSSSSSSRRTWGPS
jgi:hypothetical protein